jgi:hypothetical protein
MLYKYKLSDDFIRLHLTDWTYFKITSETTNQHLSVIVNMILMMENVELILHSL